ncbi:MAG: NAD(P)-dependent oxidoreductase [Salinimicrobium sp.]
MKLGWIGLGKMGKPMSESLIKAGQQVTVYNRTKSKEKPLKEDGAATAGSPKELVEQTEVVFLMISDDKAVDDVFHGNDGILSTDVNNKIIVNKSTVSPEISRKMANALEEKGGRYLDAPVSGSVKQANEASLVVIAGGKKDIFEKVKPLLETIGKKAILVGDTGAGNLTKLAVNTFLGVVTQGLAEVINFSRSKDIKTEDLMEILNNGALGSPFVKIKGDAAMAEDYNAAFTLSHLTKDLRLAQEAGLDAPLGNAAYKTFSKAEAELGEEDVIAIIKKL